MSDHLKKALGWSVLMATCLWGLDKSPAFAFLGMMVWFPWFMSIGQLITGTNHD